MHSSAALTRQRQIRGFVLAWLGITLVMGALTFAGIYYATGLVAGEDETSVAALPNADADSLADTAPPAEALAAPLDAAPPVVPEQPVAPAAQEAAPAADTARQPIAVPAAAGGEPDEPAAYSVAVPPTTSDAQPARQVATPIPTLTPRPIDVGGFQLGIQVQPNMDPEVYKLWMGEVRDKLKLGWIKEQVRWEVVEPQPGQYNWSELDVTLPLAQEYGNKVMLSIVTSPEWAREPGAPRVDVEGKPLGGPPTDPQTYANFITTLLYRYPGMIHAVEVWNEMNLDREWASTSGLSAQNYVTLLRAAYSAIKAVDPGIIVISGALSPTGGDGGVRAYDDFVYMDMLIQAGVLNVSDCIGAHHNGYNIGPNVPWNQVPNDPRATFRGPFDNPHHSWSFYSTLNGYAQRVQQAGSDKKLCITEFGWPTTEDLTGYPRGFEFANDNTLAEQAQFIGEAIEAMESWGFVWLAWVWNLNYGPQAGWDATNDNVPYSLLRPEWQQAPAYEVIGSYNFRER